MYQNDMIKLYKEGFGVMRLARMFGMPSPVVNITLEENGVKLRRGRTVKNPLIVCPRCHIRGTLNVATNKRRKRIKLYVYHGPGWRCWLLSQHVTKLHRKKWLLMLLVVRLYERGFTFEQIAKALNNDVNTVRKIYLQAVLGFRKSFKNPVVTCPKCGQPGTLLKTISKKDRRVYYYVYHGVGQDGKETIHYIYTHRR